MRRILDTITSAPFTSVVLEKLSESSSNGSRSIPVRGLTGSLRAVLSAVLHQQTGRPVMMVFEDPADADAVYADLVLLTGSDRAMLYRAGHHAATTVSGTLDAELLSLADVLSAISHNPHRIILTDTESLPVAVPPPMAFDNNTIVLERGKRYDMEALAIKFAHGGFERVQIVESVGQYVVRGGILDVFPVGAESPLRVEFFGSEVDSIREFDPASQRSVQEREHVELMTKVFHADETPERNSTLCDYLPADTIVVLEEPERIEGLLEDAGHTELLQTLNTYATIRSSRIAEADAIPIDARSQPAFNSSLAEFCKSIEGYRDEGYRVFIASEGEESSRRMQDMIETECDRVDEAGTPYRFAPSQLLHLDQTLSNGFILPALKLAVLTEHEVFNRRRSRTASRRARQFKGFTVRELKQLRAGDFVVHVDKGIGKFLGLETISAAGSKGEAVKLEYARGDVLYVNLNYINRLQKYSSREGAAPKLSRLGTEEWERAKARTKKRVKDIARELIRLYAERKSQPGFAYPQDTSWQRELEASFIYDDTPDQASATYATKQDMESPTPMDRLICGDVGFGKTEVAVRAAFKAVQAGKQVAVLAPTTILAQQHFNTFRDRLGRYAVGIGLLSRFRTKAEQEQTLAELKIGTVDVLIGTHRILSKDVRFKDLGLLIIDEEQRFGVSAKEKLRQMRATVDTLTLTATPIPRTLNFALMGARDLSVIETAPRNRLPIITEILRWNDEAVAEAVRRELARGGQCFVVHWRIGDIDQLAATIRDLVPNARIATAHGEMPTELLEKTMNKFIEKQFDVLIATKIIESGIDIPTANTIIINRADMFGLAELYQLRGRVGRSNVQAYALLIVPPAGALTRNALKRLQALEEFTELGSGLKLAMRDLEIRGAGNLLGAEQSGFIDEIGFELYQRIVDEAVHELKRDEFREVFQDQESVQELPLNEDLTIEIEGDALIPKSYIADDAERYDFYMRMYTARDTAGLNTVLSELRDRYGNPPQETVQLVAAVRLRLAGMPLGIQRIALRSEGLRMELPSETNVQFYEHQFQPLMKAVSSRPDAKVQMGSKVPVILFPKVRGVEEAEVLLGELKTEVTKRV